MSDNYTPVSCAVHSEYELVIMRGLSLRIRWRPANGLELTETLKPYDLVTRDGAEFLLALNENNQDIKIRLDKIIKVVS